MASEYPESTYAVLGLVDKLPNSSGYELARVAGRSFAHFWPISQTLLYRELERLTDLGWVAATRVEQIRVPAKWTYQTTAGGQQALVEWLEGSRPARSTFRSGVLLRLFFAYLMHPSQVRALLEDYRRALRSQCDEFEAISAKLEAIATPEARAGRLTALHGLRTAEARLAWADEVEGLFGEDPP
ncbi:MAG: PadR family transcriptional regulator [Actinomycetota bacterium]|nr:PadR family transcriptional regulator [Actinomycetota bacterium]